MHRYLLALLAFLFVLAPTVPATAAPPGDTVTVNVYVVPEPIAAGSRDESLAAIAGRTLGDPARAAEIFALNDGREQPDGASLTSATEVARTGWVLVLPADARGPDVRTASLARSKPYWTWPLALSLIGAVVLGVLTVLVVARRRVVGSIRRWTDRTRDARGNRQRKRRLRATRARLAADQGRDTRDVTLAMTAAAGVGSDAEVYAVVIDGDGVTAWLSTPTTPTPFWTATGSGQWRSGLPTPGPVDPLSMPARVGVTEDGGTLVVDISWLDGVLSVTGDAQGARETVDHLLREVTRHRPGTLIVDLASLSGAAELADLVRASAPALDEAGSVMVQAARRRRLTGIVVAVGEPDPETAASLVRLSSSGAGGWASVVLGRVPGAHWQWHANADGTLELPELDQTVVVPTQP
ncbi:hypothetical protein [Asanoa siamensis]|uniref:Uncharacterized protein n=1 Tax=Asanoa siamensis TaxID=926357 RepID=A0ABQ4D2G2_9ACTN|nr:hypothetical protein [Asanoa siamensis]GIF77729.1 hypothetical protein Asi02nite_72470 [Asanoa siamensis]